ncbi:hypothetical protein CVT25_004697 [Psilocybe cyanescens]|uniref:Uncharacterized protein n=1 Tax=Psilocybe cyanescens TaxID=93625 RepID=A0A409XIQ2_PSICY|nr:hypothetical protein CVT25_004697 [Psilocybe cyanescens]
MEEELEETEPIMNNTDTPLKDFNALVIDFIKAKDSEEMDQAWINAKTTASQTLAMEHENRTPAKPLEELIPLDLHDYLRLFDKKAAD